MSTGVSPALALAVMAAWAVLQGGGCSISDHHAHCAANSDCASGQVCYRSFCVASARSTKPNTSASGMRDAAIAIEGETGGMSSVGATSSADTQKPSDAGNSSGALADAAAQPDASANASAPAHSDAGQAMQTEPAERCQAGDARPCQLENPPPHAADSCKQGVQRCDSGAFSACMPVVQDAAEACNGQDDDCDGAIDEGCECTGTEQKSCYGGPTGTQGVGACVAGHQTCDNGKLGVCMGSVVPKPESCANPNVDDDCNHKVDDIPGLGAPCTIDANLGACKQGTLQCQSGKAELVCVAPAPVTELCNGIDDNCDGKTDETFDLQNDASHCGSCTHACAQGEVCCAGQCSNPNSDALHCGGCTGPACAAGSGCCNGQCLDLTSDAMHCGACGQVCAAGETCCASKCINPMTDPAHCGTCANACSGSHPGCCAGSCVDFLSNANCGSCGHACGLLNGVTCTCATTDSGTGCVAPVLGLCL